MAVGAYFDSLVETLDDASNYDEILAAIKSDDPVNVSDAGELAVIEASTLWVPEIVSALVSCGVLVFVYESVAAV